jgi:hypothetical protein
MYLFNTSPVTVGTIAQCQSSWNMSSSDMGWLLGLSIGPWGRLVRDSREQPDRLADPRHALLLRWLADHKDQAFDLLVPSAPGALFQKLASSVPTGLTKRWFALALGLDQSAAQRWMSRHSQIHPATRRAVSVLSGASPADAAARWTEWCVNARREARLRGLGDLDRRASWNPTRQEVKGNP